MNERIKQVRTALHLSQDEFARRLGLTRGAITNIELNKTEPKPLLVDLICKEYKVNENWLRDGDGDMFIHLSREEEISGFVADLVKGSPSFKTRFISVLAQLSSDEWALLEQMAKKLAAEEQKEKADL